MKRFKYYFLLIVFCLIMNGCARKNNTTTIQFASWGSQSEIAILKPILNEFEKENPDIKVDFIHIPQDYFQKIHLLYASNLAPDVIFINNLYLPYFANAGVLQNLEVNNYNNIFYKKSVTALSYKGKLYAIPRDISNLVIYYNKDIFNKYEEKIPNKYWTFKDFLLTSQKLTKDTNHDGKTDIWGISFDETPPLFYLPYLMSEGGGFLSKDTKKIIINNKESKKGLQFYSDLRNKYHSAPNESESASATMAQLFLQGKLAMQLSGRWLVPKYSNEANFNWGIVSFPKGDKGSIVPLDASGWAISKNSKHKTEAEKLINFLASKKSSEKFSQSGLIVPARIDVARGEFLHQQKKINSKNSPLINKVFIDVIKNSMPTPVSVNYDKLQDNITEKTKYLFNQ